MRLAVSFLSMGLLLSSASAHAEEPARGFSLEYTAPAQCPGPAAFVAAVAARSRTAHEVAPPEARLMVGVTIQDRGAQASGSLLLRLPDGQQSRREIPEATCKEIISSMAVITAMVLDAGDLEASFATPAASAPSATNPAADVAGSDDIQLRLPSVSSDCARANAESAAAGANLPKAAPPEPPMELRARGVLRVGMETAMAPTAAMSAAAGFDLALAAGTQSLRLMAVWAEAARSTTPHGTADFRRISVELSVCPVRWAAMDRLGLALCAMTELGRLSGAGENTYNPKTQHMLWLGFGPSVRAEAAVSRWMRLELDLGAQALVRHDQFVFAPNTQVHDVPWAAAGCRFGVTLGGH